jgi:hypothetical protein
MGMAVGRGSLHETTELGPLRSLTSCGNAGSHSGKPATAYKDEVWAGAAAA